jgi:hypothetical protein
VSTDLDQIFAGVAAWISEYRQQDLIDDFVLAIGNSAEGDGSFAKERGGLRSTEDGIGDSQGGRPADPDHS